MGAKLQFCFLSEDRSKDILLNSLSILFDFGVNYNEYIQGEYTYWKDGPIWKFGESNTICESDGHVAKTVDEIMDVIEILAENFSPSIILGMMWFDKPLAVVLSICENDEHWKDVNVSIEREDVLDSLSKADKETASLKLKELFKKLALRIKPYIGVGATELSGFSSPEKLEIGMDNLGDFNYLSNGITSRLEISIYEDEYSIEVLEDGNILLNKLSGRLELG